ncbi:VOC family protein [Luteococcus sp. H138]|uniref:VOC family protein n=1 Tax=unclassified Luteococcus TaxID=2639923 RepID=UPI00313DCCD0
MDPHEPTFTPALSAITLLVADQDAAEEFYSRAFAEEPLWRDGKSIGFGLGSVVLNLLLDSEGDRLVTPAAVGSKDSGLRSQLSIWVDDIDTVVETLKGRGVDFDTDPTDQTWGMRTATFRDPDGHSWEIAQDLGD